MCGAGLFTAARTAPTHLAVPRLWWEQRLSCVVLQAAAPEEIEVSCRSIYRRADCLDPFCQSGNRERTTIVGVDLLRRVTYIMAWPDAILDKMAVFIYNEGGGLYYCQAISKHLAELDITKKGLLPKATRHNSRTFSLECGDSGIAPPPLAFFRCHKGGSLTWMSLGLRLRDATARGDGP